MADIPRFIEFIREVADEDMEWTYEDGTPMAADAQEFLMHLKAIAIAFMWPRRRNRWGLFS